MTCIRGGATVLGLSLALLLIGGVARAQDVTGKITGRVVDKDNGQPLSGVTVIVQGPQGDDATLTDGKGDYYFSTLPVGTYVIRFYVASSSTKTEQDGVIVSADKTVRVNARIAGQAMSAAAEETYVISRRPPAVDVGSTRLGPTFDSNFTKNVPVGRNFGDILEKAPGAFVDRTGSVSIGGATGLENIYLVDGLNVTGAEYGNINSNSATLGGGSNFPVEFLDQVAVNTGGYNAEFGGAMGGVVNAVTKSGSNDLHGSAFGYWSPYFLAGEPKVVNRIGSALSSVSKPDYDTNIGVEVGGPILKNKLFFWVGFAPRFQEDHVFRFTHPILPDGSSGPEVDRRRINAPRSTYHYGAKLDFVPAPDHRLTLSLFGSPSSGQGMRAFQGFEAVADPAWARETVVRDTTDVSAHWISKLYDRKWQIEANVGMHREYFNNYSPDAARNYLNQQEWWGNGVGAGGSNLWDLEHTAGCEPQTVNGSTYEPCPVDFYHNGGFGLVKKYDATRWSWDLKSTHTFELGGHHELKYGWHGEATAFNQDRYYSGPLGARGTVIHYPDSFSTWNFFTLPSGVLPYQVSSTPYNLLGPPDYQDHLKADVANLINHLFIQDSYSVLPNLTFNVGARYEMQNMYDSHSVKFLGLTSIAPRVGVVFDPTNEGRSKIFAHYGQYSESIPLSIASRYFGGEGILIAGNTAANCPPTNPPSGWIGNGTTEWRTCTPDPNPGNYSIFNNGSNYPVQPHLKAQFHSEVVAGIQREVMEDLVVGLDYTHRWLGDIIEDGTATDGTFVLANPGSVPPAALSDLQKQVDKNQALVNQRQAEFDAATGDARTAAQTALATAQTSLGASQSVLANLKGLAAEPKPERTYDALTLFVDKRFSRHWLVHASYTYSRLVGNYEGLYQDHQDYFAPNGNNSYDTPELTVNARGLLPNDHPHSGRVDGYYTQPIGQGSLVFGLGFAARSGQPRNYMSNLGCNCQIVHLLPRGAGGRTPPVSEFDGKLSYRRPLTAKTTIEAFVDVFNLFNQQAVLRTDDDYTFQPAAPIVNGTKDDLKYAKNASGGPLAVNPNFGRPIAYQAPIHGRLGLRLTF